MEPTDVIYLTEDFEPVDENDPRMVMVKVRFPDGRIVFGFPEKEVEQNQQLFTQGGPGSGYRDHPGRPNQVGGSLSRSAVKRSIDDWEEEEDQAPYSKAEQRVLDKLQKAVGTSEFFDEIEFREDEDITPGLLDRKGRIQSGKGAVQIYETNSDMQMSSCHENSSLLVQQGKAVAIGTGFAFIKGKKNAYEGVWIQHSWAYDKKGRILETTVKRDVYFGVRLEGRALKEFIEYNSFDEEEL